MAYKYYSLRHLAQQTRSLPKVGRIVPLQRLQGSLTKRDRRKLNSFGNKKICKIYLFNRFDIDSNKEYFECFSKYTANPVFPLPSLTKLIKTLDAKQIVKITRATLAQDRPKFVVGDFEPTAEPIAGRMNF